MGRDKALLFATAEDITVDVVTGELMVFASDISNYETVIDHEVLIFESRVLYKITQNPEWCLYSNPSSDWIKIKMYYDVEK